MLNLGYCGDDCNSCPRYAANLKGSEKRLKEVMAMWQIVGWESKDLPADKFVCLGCESVKTCGLGVKECLAEKGTDSCGKCDEYPCEKMRHTFENNKKEAALCREKFSRADYELFEKAFFSKQARLDKINRAYRPQNSDIVIERAKMQDAAAILKLQKLAYLSEAAIYNDYSIPPLTQTLKEIKDDFRNNVVLKAVRDGVIIGSVRGQLNQEGDCYIGRLMVHPDFQHRGTGTRLIHAIQAEFPQVKRFTLGTGHRSDKNIRLYQKLGFRQHGTEHLSDSVTIVLMEKVRG
ncbi:MAG: GNAT family N-acetyltransferase [Dehalococcoidales bacterium]|jgi:ribosomal protein S18 acetylase RimI-like enzyme